MLIPRRSIYYGTKKRPLVLWSGGLDSTWLLERFKTPVDVLSINLLEGNERSIRALMEQKARESLKPHMLAHNYKEASINIDCGITVGDVVQTSWIAAQYAKHMNFTERDVILYGGNSDDDLIFSNFSNETAINKKRSVVDVFRIVYQYDHPPEYTWIKPEPSRLQQLQDLGEIANLTWSCRNPQQNSTTSQYEVCNECKPCVFINKAKQKV